MGGNQRLSQRGYHIHILKLANKKIQYFPLSSIRKKQNDCEKSTLSNRKIALHSRKQKTVEQNRKHEI